MSKSIAAIEEHINEATEVTIDKNLEGAIEFTIANIAITFEKDIEFGDILDDINKIYTLYSVSLEENLLDAIKDFSDENPEYYN